MFFPFFGGLGSRYNPLINYKWNTSVSSDYITDGIELVTNGGFDTDVANWTASSASATIVWNSGTAIASNTADWAYIRQSSVVDVGIYLVSFDILAIDKEVHIGLGVNGNSVSTVGAHSYIYEATALTDFQIRPFSAGLYNIEIDNVSVKKVLQKPNTQYLVDSGTAPKYHAEMFSGQGVSLLVDQSVTIPDVGATSMIYRFNGVATYTETPFYVISTDGIWKDVFYLSDILTPTEISKYSSNPNGFFQDVQDGVIDNCVLNMPLDGKDKFVRDYVNYAEVEKFNNDFSLNTDGIIARAGNTLSIVSNAMRITMTTTLFRVATTSGFPTTIGSKYLVNTKIINNTSSSGVNLVYSTTLGGAGTSVTIPENTDFSFIFTATSTTTYLEFLNSSSIVVGETIDVDYLEAIELSGIHEIANFTTASRTDADNLNYGTQELNFIKSGLWRGELSSYLECEGLGYVDTGWVPDPSVAFSVEFIFASNREGTKEEFGLVDALSSSRFFLTKETTNSIYMNVFGVYVISTFQSLSGIYNHYLVTYNGVDTFSLYVNGNILGTSTGLAGTLSTNSFYLGKTNSYTTALVNTFSKQMFKLHTDTTKALEDYLAQYP